MLLERLCMVLKLGILAILSSTGDQLSCRKNNTSLLILSILFYFRLCIASYSLTLTVVKTLKRLVQPVV